MPRLSRAHYSKLTMLECRMDAIVDYSGDPADDLKVTWFPKARKAYDHIRHKQIKNIRLTQTDCMLLDTWDVMFKGYHGAIEWQHARDNELFAALDIIDELAEAKEEVADVSERLTQIHKRINNAEECNAKMRSAFDQFMMYYNACIV